jgi:alkylation response protein AidB-like acyl-CoA dehydrogenase
LGGNLSHRETLPRMDSIVDFHADTDPLIADLLKYREPFQNAVRRPGAEDRFPIEVVDTLRQLGILAAPLPGFAGGRGWGTEDAEVSVLCAALQIIGSASLAVGRIYEAHVNAIALIFQYGDPRVRALTAEAVHKGHLFALWVAPAPDPVKMLDRGSHFRITGRKAFGTAAGFASHAVVTAFSETGDEHMVLMDTIDAAIDHTSAPTLQGMRNTSTKAVTFDCDVPRDRCFGGSGDYLREPDFSVGAWRTSAVTVGGMQSLVDETINQLRARGRHTNPHQAARIGQMLIKLHTAEAWINSVSERLVSRVRDTRHLTGYVHLARLAIEQACLEIIPLVQRSLGLPGFLTGNPVEGLMRDLATYLRQPAADDALTDAAITFAETARPSALGSHP